MRDGERHTDLGDGPFRDSDGFSMGHSPELRVPFTDTTLLVWLWPQFPQHQFPSRVPKRALAEAMADLVPAAIRERPKQGFTLPFPVWRRAELRPFLEDCFSPQALARCPCLCAPAAQEVWRNLLAGQDPRAWSRVWALAILIAFANRGPGP